MKNKCRVSCADTLCHECGMEVKLAERYADAIFLDAEGFRHVLAELRGFVETPFDVAVTREDGQWIEENFSVDWTGMEKPF